MAGEDYSVGTKVTADVSNFEKGMNKAEKSLKGFSDKLANSIDRLGKKGLVGSVANVTLAMQGLTKSFNTVIKFAKDVGKAINECTEAYKGQLIAERALDTAIQNNPFISGASSKALKQFASEMQKVSNYGDEQLIPMMTNLVSLGRTESETMQIMSVAMDMSAGMGISLDTAITQLNATLNGNIGRLGQQNAELKNLTEEELKQGKAIEILGEKFKGLSSATADTSKQLQNIKGDFKEALGQFTLPSSDMWNKFWAGFYERGIEVIGKINAYIDAQTIGRKLASEYVKQIKAISTEKVYNPETGIYDVRDLGARVKYIREALKVLSDEELEALNNYLSSQRRLNDEEQQLLNRIKAEQDSRYQGSVNAKKEAEEKKKQADAEAQITAELQKQEEIASKKTDWASKLLDQRIEMLETERDRAMQLAEEEGKEAYTIWRDYNEKILELKLERLEKEKTEALKEEGLTADDKIKVEEYYSGETKKIYDELGQYKRKKDKEEKKELKDKIKDKLKLIGTYAKEVSKVLNKIGKVIKAGFTAYIKVIDNAIKIATKMLKGAFDVFTKLIEFNISDALDILLKFEDSVLSFFVETLPQLPQFVSTVLKSINTMLSSLINSVKAENVATVIYGILDDLANNLPNIVQNILTIIQNMISFSNENLADIVYKFLKILEENAIPVVEGLLDLLTNVIKDSIDGLFKWLDEGGLQSLLKLALKIQTSVQDVFMKLLTSVADLLENHTGDVTKFISDSLQKAMEDLPKLVDALLRIVNSLIKSVADLFKDKKFVDTMVKSMIDTFNSLMDRLPDIIGSVVDLILSLITALVPKLPEIILAVITKIVETIPKIINEIVGKIGAVISDIFSRIFTAEFWQEVFGKIGEGFQKIFDSLGKGLQEIFTRGGYGKNSTGSTVGDIAVDFLVPFGFLRHFFADGTNNAPSGLAVVGEAGPELVRFRGGEQVLNANNTQKALSGMSGTTINQNVTFNNLQDTTAYAMMNQFKQYNRQMAINGVI
jgi:predicted PurR-regulated permease PerM